MPTYFKKLLHLGDRMAVYDGLIRSLTGEEERPDEWRLEDALIVAGLHYRSAELLPVFWPGDTGDLFTTIDDYLPALLSIAHSSPFERVRCLAVAAFPIFDTQTVNADHQSSADFPPELQIVIDAKRGFVASFVKGLLILIDQMQMLEATQWSRIGGAPLSVDYCISHRGPFLYFADGGKGRGYQPIDQRQLYELLRIPLRMEPAQQLEAFNRIVPKVTTSTDLFAFLRGGTSIA